MKLKEKTETLYSFDIFDTLITRKTATPKGIFRVVQELIKNEDYPDFLKANFAAIRFETEDFVRRNLKMTRGAEDITFDEIYDRIQTDYSLNFHQTSRLKELEIHCEMDNLKAVDTNINRLKTLVNKGEKVILISDMYHSKDTLKRILTNIDPVFNDIEVYVSSEFRLTKSTGSIYRFIREEFNPVNWEHCGDNLFADIRNARKNKIAAKIFPYIKLKNYELEALKKDSNPTTELFIGIAKNLRLKSNNKKYDFGASFAGPILYSYVSWIIDSSVRTNTKDLYFIARDGYIPKLIADVIIKEKNLDIKTHYIYGSRKSWRVVSKETVDNFIECNFTEYFDRFSSEFICKRFDMTKEECEKYFNIPYNKKILKSKKRKTLYKKLITDKEFKKFLINKHAPKKELLVKYLNQEIDFSSKFAFVDLFGSGRTQDNISAILLKRIETYYFSCSLAVQNYNDSLKKVFCDSYNYNHHWLELLCRHTDGQTLGYTNLDGIIKPVIENCNDNDLKLWGYESYLEGITDFAKEAVKINLPIRFDFYKHYFNFIMKDIDRETATILGSIPYSEIGKDAKECAPEMGLFSAFKLLCSKDSRFVFISKGRSKGMAKTFLDIKLKYKTFRKFLINVYSNRNTKELYICLLGIKINLRGNNE